MKKAEIPNSRFFDKHREIEIKTTDIKRNYGEIVSKSEGVVSKSSYVDFDETTKKKKYDPFLGVTIYDGMINIIPFMSSSEQMVFSYICSNLVRGEYDVSINVKSIVRHWHYNGKAISEKSAYRGIQGLKERNLIFNCEKDVYWINYMYFFRGNRTSCKSKYNIAPDFKTEIMQEGRKYD